MLVYISILFSPYLLLLLVHLVKLVLSSLLVKIKLSPRSLASTGSMFILHDLLFYSVFAYLPSFPLSPIHPPIHFLKKLRFPNSKTRNSVYRQVQRYAPFEIIRSRIKKKLKKRANTSQCSIQLPSDVDFIENFYQESIFFFLREKIMRNIMCIFL